MNPGGSIKDRTAKGLVESAERSGELKPGDTIVEGTGEYYAAYSALLLCND